jgi:fatty acyl-CoA reductase
LIEEVSVVFHSAATVKFDEDLTKAVKLNVVAVFTIMELCKKIKKTAGKFCYFLSVLYFLPFLIEVIHYLYLQALVHVSTAYSNTQFKHISEEIYSMNVDPLGIVGLCEVSSILTNEDTDSFFLENGSLCTKQS